MNQPIHNAYWLSRFESILNSASKRTLNSSLRHGSFAAFWLHNNKGRLTRGCNPTSSKFIHTWLRFGEIMRGSLRTQHCLAQSVLPAYYAVQD